jgi:hypothetical protein
VRAELRALTIRTSYSARGAQKTVRPTFFRDWRYKGYFATVPRVDLPVRQKVASHDSTVGGRGKWFLITINCVPAGKEPTLPRRNW